MDAMKNDVEGAVAEALANPVGSPPLRELEAAGLRRDLKALQLELGLTQYNRVFEPPVMS